jgi:hypothetical protein
MADGGYYPQDFADIELEQQAKDGRSRGKRKS